LDNQHRLITGYRDLPQQEIDLMNEIEAHAEQTRELVNRVERYCIARDDQPLPEGHAPHSTVTLPLRWAAEGRTDLQKGYMSLVRAVAAPNTF
jgi:hypothetical protein